MCDARKNNKIIKHKMKHFQLPFRLIISGPSFSGKTCLVLNIIKNREQLFDGPSIKHLVWCCKNKSFVPEEIARMPMVEIYEGLADLNDLKPHTLLVIDDLMSTLSNEILDVFTVHSHHLNISIILIVQNLFHQNKCMRDVSLNSNYFCLLKNPRDVGQFQYFARQINYDNWKNLLKVYSDVCGVAYQPLIIDLSQKTDNLFKYKTNILNKNYFETYATETDIQNSCSESFTAHDNDKVYVAVLKE